MLATYEPLQVEDKERPSLVLEYFRSVGLKPVLYNRVGDIAYYILERVKRAVMETSEQNEDPRPICYICKKPFSSK